MAFQFRIQRHLRLDQHRIRLIPRQCKRRITCTFNRWNRSSRSPLQICSPSTGRNATQFARDPLMIFLHCPRHASRIVFILALNFSRPNDRARFQRRNKCLDARLIISTVSDRGVIPNLKCASCASRSAFHFSFRRRLLIQFIFHARRRLEHIKRKVRQCLCSAG